MSKPIEVPNVPGPKVPGPNVSGPDEPEPGAAPLTVALSNASPSPRGTPRGLWPDLRGRHVLITGGTRGIGLATGLAFASHGAHVTLTSKWGSSDEDAIRASFATLGDIAPAPLILQADAGHNDDVEEVLEAVRDHQQRHDHASVASATSAATAATAPSAGLYALISNVAFGAVVPSVEDYSRRALQTTIDYTAWPIVTHALAARRIFGAPPRHVIGLSSEGADSMLPGYDLVAAAKAVLETLCRYLHYRLAPEGARVNVVRTRFVDTDSLAATLGDAFVPFVKRFEPDVLSTADEVAAAILGLCSGAMDSVGGQIITVDRGAHLFDNFSRLYSERDRYPIPVTLKEQS